MKIEKYKIVMKVLPSAIFCIPVEICQLDNSTFGIFGILICGISICGISTHFPHSLSSSKLGVVEHHNFEPTPASVQVV